jgi:hypothetical protein
MKRIFMIECDEFPMRDLQLIHIYIRKKLDPKNKNLVIKSIPLNKKTEALIFDGSI